MLAAFLRSAARVALVAIVAAAMSFVLGYIVPYFYAEDGHTLVRLFTLGAEHYLLIGLVAVAVQLGARALVEGNGGPAR